MNTPTPITTPRSPSTNAQYPKGVTGQTGSLSTTQPTNEQQVLSSSSSTTTATGSTTISSFPHSASILSMIEDPDKKKGEKEKEENETSPPSSNYPLVDPSIYKEKIGEEEEAQAFHRWRQLKFVVRTLLNT